MTLAPDPYQARPIRFLELWRHGLWRIKVYGIACGRPAPRPELIAAAKLIAAERLLGATDSSRHSPSQHGDSSQHYAVGFLGVHEGRTANFVFVDWWADENELHHHVYVSPTSAPSQFSYATPTGLVACVWDLRVLAFERQAWLNTVLKRPGGPDLDAYLNQQLNEDI